MKIPKVKYLKFSSNRQFGLELEMNNKVPPQQLVRIVSSADPDHPVIHSNHYQVDHNNDYWHIKFDRSCGEEEGQGGWEVASYRASGFCDLNVMSKVADALKKGGAIVNNNCALHIHAEMLDFTELQISTLVSNWLKIENVVCEMVPRHRRNNKYCRLLSRLVSADRVYTPSLLWKSIKPARYDHPSRRVSLNFCNYVHVPNRKTIELRMPECILDGKEVKNWLRFFLHFIETAKKSSFDGNIAPVNLYEMMKIIGLHNENPFFVLSPGLRETKIWVANRILKNSVKRKFRKEARTFLNALEVVPSQTPEVLEIVETPMKETWIF